MPYVATAYIEVGAINHGMALAMRLPLLVRYNMIDKEYNKATTCTRTVTKEERDIKELTQYIYYHWKYTYQG